MILHFSHIGLTDGLTFMFPFRRLEFRRHGSGCRCGSRYRTDDAPAAEDHASDLGTTQNGSNPAL